jgi:predicted transposase YbfD/YdcC
MAVTEAQARRAVRRAELSWAPEVKDPRAEKGQRYTHHGLLSLLMTAFACGLVCLRRVEDLSEDLGLGARRKLGIPRRVSDTAIYQLLARQEAVGFRETVWKQVRALIDGKVIENDLFAHGVLSVDGKCCWKSTSTHVEGAKTSTDPETGVATSSFSAFLGVLTSSSARPCLDMELIAEKSGEAPAFRKLLPRVCEQFGGQFRIVTADAGLTCRENARVVLEQGKYYLFSLKGNQPNLHQLAEDAFAGQPGPTRAHTSDRRNGSTLFRELHIINVEGAAEVHFPGAVELWRIKQATVPDEPAQAGAEEVRYFVSNMPASFLSPTQKLELVRLHWGIENGHNWTVDVALEEDDVRPCQTSRDSIAVVTWLRVLAYNLLATWRAGGPKKDRRPLPWNRAMERLRDAFLVAKPEPLATLV